MAMKITPNGLRLLTAINMAHLERKNQLCGLLPLDAPIAPKMLSLDEFYTRFPEERGEKEGLVALAKKLNEENINQRVALLFFGGDEHARSVKANLLAKGFHGAALNSLVLFGTLLAVRIEKLTKKGLFGTYMNNSAEVLFTGISLLCWREAKVNERYLLWRGYVIGHCSKQAEEILVDAQCDSEILSEACFRVGTVNLDKIPSPEHYLPRKRDKEKCTKEHFCEQENLIERSKKHSKSLKVQRGAVDDFRGATRSGVALIMNRKCGISVSPAPSEG